MSPQEPTAAGIIDMHAHLGNHGGGYMHAGDPSEQVRYMDRSGVSCAIAVGHYGLFTGPEGIAMDLAVARGFPGRFMLYYPVVAPMLAQYPGLRALEENPEFAGLKFLCEYYGVPFSDPRHEPFWEYADDRGLPVLVHTWKTRNSGFREAEKILGRYRNLTFIAGHSFMGETDLAAKMGGAYGNLYYELTAVLNWKGAFEPLQREGVLDRVLFGVDAPWFSYEYYLGALDSTGVSEREKGMILRGNALKVLAKAGITVGEAGFGRA